MDEQVLKLDYNIVLKRVNNQTGEVIDSETLHNLVVTDGLELVNDFLAGNAPTEPTHLAIGTGTTAPTVGDTALETEDQRSAPAITEPTAVSTQFEETFTFGSPTDITELGLFNAGVGGTMFNRATFTAKSVSATIDLIATVTVTVS